MRDHCYNIVIEDFGSFPAAGRTNTNCVDSQVRVELNKEYWEQTIQPLLDHPSGFYKDPYMFGFHLIWHELGHDILNLQHTCNETPNFLIITVLVRRDLMLFYNTHLKCYGLLMTPILKQAKKIRVFIGQYQIIINLLI